MDDSSLETRPSEHTNLLAPTEDQLSVKVLEQIETHKSLIAELRPARRKIKWKQHISDWDRNPVHKSKIEDLQLHDLQGLRMQASAVSPGKDAAVDDRLHKSFSSLDILEDFYENPVEHIDEIESNVEKCLKTIRRVKRETQTNRRTCTDLQQKCSDIRKELQQLPIPPRQQAMRQVQQQLESTKKHLEEKQAELDEQIGMLRMQHNRLAADIALSRELLEDDDRKLAVEYLHTSFHRDDDSDIDSQASCLGDELQSSPLHDADPVHDLPAYPRSDSAALSRRSDSLNTCELDLKQRKPATPAAA